MLIAAGHGAADRKALSDLSIIFRDGINVPADQDESMRWAALLGILDNDASAAQTLQRLGYPRSLSGGSAAAGVDVTPLVDQALVASLREQRPSQQQSRPWPLMCLFCCMPGNVRRALSPRTPNPQHPKPAVTVTQVVSMFTPPSQTAVTVTANSMLLLWSSAPQPAFLGVCRTPGQYYIPHIAYKHALLPCGEHRRTVSCVVALDQQLLCCCIEAIKPLL
jgi:hypothetical protein